MCYDIKATYESQLKRAEARGDIQAVEEIKEKLIPFTDLPLFHSSGFSHPDLLIYTDDSPYFPTIATWGLIPHWVRDEEGMKKIWNNTLNARGETIFEKPSFKESAKHHRCLIYIDGFYEHHHYNGSTYPFYIYRKDGKPMILAGLWNDWETEFGGIVNSFSIVTTEGNSMMAKIHNNPKLKGPRMPLILFEELADVWLNPINDDIDKKLIQELIKPYPVDELTYHSVAKLRGKEYPGNLENISDEVVYKELVF
ncbi:SOS response-associated peptidase [Yeosuana sp. MJ-SS3]|uniref:Abasic site processing protein n=1 Tax=Gilvirhabdus luticola TaxID=3079858 RepID=A0ABU3U9Q1_9FLAO|nr:SOS response-associated peptidase [Yeosuana sp. MJ-SS3]MDU8887082.1 SOS response-associated peptidase [Yeosuana sp. MJ-SS3]